MNLRVCLSVPCSLFTENVLAHPCIVFRRQCQVSAHLRVFSTKIGFLGFLLFKVENVKNF